jgi:PilZ domain-containing protein
MRAGLGPGERRRHPRTPVSWPIRLWAEGAVIDGRAQDVSVHGICIATAPTAAVKLGASYRIDVLAGVGPPHIVVADARHADSGRIGFESDLRLIELADTQ